MAIELRCPECRQVLRVGDRFAGLRGTCTRCGAKIIVPGGGVSDREADELADLDSWYVGPVKRPLPWGWIAGSALVALTMAAGLLLAVKLTSRGAAPPAPPSSPPIVEVGEGADRSGSARPWAPPGLPQPPRGSPSLVASGPKVPAVPPGPLSGEVAARVDRILEEWLRRMVPADVAATRTVARGSLMSVTLDGHVYEGRTFEQFSIVATEPGKPKAERLFVMATTPWPVGDDLVVAPGCRIVREDGAYRIMDVAAFEAETRARAEYLDTVLRRIDMAIARRDWHSARQTLDEAMARFPTSLELTARAQRISHESKYVVITIVNRTAGKLPVVLRRDGVPAIKLSLKRAAVRKLKLRIGDYVAAWGNTGSREEIKVVRPETWEIHKEAHLRPGGPAQYHFFRKLEKIGQ